MDINQFWESIEKVKSEHSGAERIELSEKMCDELVKRAPTDIIEWTQIFQTYISIAQRNDLRMAASALGADISGYPFEDFLAWLISQGKETYMAALRDPDSLADISTPGVQMHDDTFASSGYEAYGDILNLAKGEDLTHLVQKLDTHRLSDQTLKEIREDVPQDQDRPDKQLPIDYSALYPRIWARMTSRLPEIDALEEEFDYLIPIRGVAYAHVYQGNGCEEFRLVDSPQNIASFIGQHPTARKIILTDTLDRFLLETRGNLIDNCPDKELLARVLHFLAPIQQGKLEPNDIICEWLTRPAEQTGDMEMKHTM